MSRGVYISGTDTGVGKSLCSAALLSALRASGVRAVGMKPVASGARDTPHGLRNEDAELLMAHGEPGIDYAQINPYVLREPIAPSIAAAEAGIEIELAVLRRAYDRLAAQSELVVVEGVGGWAAPLSNTLMQADLVRALGVPVILVVGLRLGCINHAVLSARAILADGAELLGWIANSIDPQMLRLRENIATLSSLLPVPCLGLVPMQTPPDPRALGAELGDALRALRDAPSLG